MAVVGGETHVTPVRDLTTANDITDSRFQRLSYLRANKWSRPASLYTGVVFTVVRVRVVVVFDRFFHFSFEKSDLSFRTFYSI